MTNFFVYLSVVVCGAAVLALEILGTRVIAPFYGASLYLWSALITVTLAALSLGYALGGRYADRGVQLKRFATLILLAGLWVVVIPWIKSPLLGFTESLGLRAAVLVSAMVLFFPPLTLLGMVTPYALKMKADSLKVVGRTAGNLYAISTIASVVAALVTGFFLIPNLGVLRLTFTIGIMLVATGLLGLIFASKSSAVRVISIALIGLSFYSLALAPSQKPDPGNGLIDVRQSPYAELRVVDKDLTRFMLIDGGTHTIIDPFTYVSDFPYVCVLDIPKLFFDRPGDMLLIGLGGGSVAKSYAQNKWNVDAVEIDPVVTELAYEYFGLKPDEATVYTMDGRNFLLRHEADYDLIIMDAFGSSSIPFQLVTSEAFGLIHDELADTGLFAVNMEAVGWNDPLVKSLAATAMTQFEHVIILPIVEPPDQLGNLIMLASDRELTLTKELPRPENRNSAEYDRQHAWDNQFVVDTSGVPVLTDDLNPVDIWAERINLVARRGLHEYFADDEMGW